MKRSETEDDVGLGPRIVPALGSNTGGVDFLGLRQVNLELTGYCIPGINNTTRLIRPFSVLSWIHWRFHQELEDAGKKKVTSAELSAFQEKAEILFTWGHKLEGLSGVPGVRANPPEPKRGLVELSFAAWKRTRNNTSLQAPVQYGPAIRPTYGLGFLEPMGHDFFRPTEEGEALARALDSSLSKAEVYDQLCDLNRTRGGESDARDLFQRWRADNPSRKEADVFRAALFDPAQVDSPDIMGRRSAMISAILKTLRRARRELSEHEIRSALAWNRVPGGKEISLSGGPAKITKHWKVLQIRQAQRVAMEAMLSWFEATLESGEARLEGIHTKLHEALANEKFSQGGKRTCAEALKSFCRGLPTESDYILKSANGDERDILARTPDIKIQTKADPATSLPSATALLLGIVAWSRWLMDDEELKRDLRLGGVDRVSLWHLHESFQRFADRPWAEWLGDVLERWVIGQHLRVATMRFDGRTQRLRFGFGESGLEFYANRPSIPNLTPDHLAAILSLMENCGLLSFDATEGTFGLR